MFESLETTIFRTDSLSYYCDPAPDSTNSLPVYIIHQTPPSALYGQHSKLMAPVKNENHLSHLVQTPLWEGWLATVVIFIFLLCFRHITTYFRQAASSLFSFRSLQKQYKENSLLLRNIRQILLLFGLFVAAFLIYLLLTKSADGIFFDNWQLYFIILGVILSYLLLKRGLLWLIGAACKSTDAFSMLNYSGQLYIIACCFLLLPMPVVLLIGNTFQLVNIAIAVICGLGAFLYLVRSFQIFYSAKFSIFFWFLYLCTFEVAPILVLYRFLIVN